MTRQPLTAEQVYDAALAILDEDGLAGLNARHLTRRLSCSTKTLYQLVGNRDAMVRGIVRHAFLRMDLEFRPGPDWRDSLRSWARTLHAALLARPYLGSLMTVEDRDATVAYVNRLVDVLVEAGFRTRTAVEVAGNVGHWTIGSTLLDLRAPGEWDQPERFEATLDWLVRGIDQAVTQGREER
ncbi:TetR/AcrR family transcriptional regulator C-terminal domain-containing protein [Nocardioides dongkuii]|uniref:TetR/AcrR family transcriptional regulator C-terminal domain-containing protein n=1 Tax=Nocardioides dongkuii TaxID=2760089 RepID=UPI0015FAE102|nr:TetR/AcrR family transcriptional regulator C-terminal domain-containing protein [Nocardioides dongkuii]